MYRGVTPVAVKQLHADDGQPMNNAARDEFMRETNILKCLHHPNLVSSFGSLSDFGHFLPEIFEKKIFET